MRDWNAGFDIDTNNTVILKQQNQIADSNRIEMKFESSS